MVFFTGSASIVPYLLDTVSAQREAPLKEKRGIID
jgi:hypothetical protein